MTSGLMVSGRAIRKAGSTSSRIRDDSCPNQDAPVSPDWVADKLLIGPGLPVKVVVMVDYAIRDAS